MSRIASMSSCHSPSPEERVCTLIHVAQHGTPSDVRTIREFVRALRALATNGSDWATEQRPVSSRCRMECRFAELRKRHPSRSTARSQLGACARVGRVETPLSATTIAELSVMYCKLTNGTWAYHYVETRACARANVSAREFPRRVASAWVCVYNRDRARANDPEHGLRAAAAAAAALVHFLARECARAHRSTSYAPAACALSRGPWCTHSALVLTRHSLCVCVCSSVCVRTFGAWRILSVHVWFEDVVCAWTLGHTMRPVPAGAGAQLFAVIVCVLCKGIKVVARTAFIR